MPARDKTGPSGKGAQTGRGMGNCSPSGLGRNKGQKSGLGKKSPSGRGGKRSGR